MLLKLGISVSERVRQVAQVAARDRGEGPVPYIILVGTIVVIVVALGVSMTGLVNGWVAKIPK